jgi:hypothetical protein
MLRLHVGIGRNHSLAQYLVAAYERLGRALAAVEQVSDRSIRAFLAMHAAAFGGIALNFVKAIKCFIDLAQTNFVGTVTAMKMLPRVLLAGAANREQISNVARVFLHKCRFEIFLLFVIVFLREHFQRFLHAVIAQENSLSLSSGRVIALFLRCGLQFSSVAHPRQKETE